jgi:rare lipoprotein A
MKPFTGLLAIVLLAATATAAPMVHSAPQPTFDFGRASWYGWEWTTGRRGTMANGQRFNPRAWTAASYDYPLGTVLEVTNQANGVRVAVMVTDRGPAKRLGRLLDLSEAAATALGYHQDGTAVVAVRVLVLPQPITKVPAK